MDRRPPRTFITTGAKQELCYPMTKRAFKIRVAETRFFEFEVWGESPDEARQKAGDVWREASMSTIAAWEMPNLLEVKYHVTQLARRTAIRKGE